MEPTIDEKLTSHSRTCDILSQEAKKSGNHKLAKRWDTRSALARNGQYGEYIDNDELAEGAEFRDLKYEAVKHHRKVSLNPMTHKEVKDGEQFA